MDNGQRYTGVINQSITKIWRNSAFWINLHSIYAITDTKYYKVQCCVHRKFSKNTSCFFFIKTPYNHRPVVLDPQADDSNLCCPVMHTGQMFQISTKINFMTQVIYLFKISTNKTQISSNFLKSIPVFCVLLFVLMNWSLFSSNISRNTTCLFYTLFFKHHTSHLKTTKQFHLTTVSPYLRNYR